MTGCDFAHHDAAYVLGALAPDDRLAFERHLTSCSSCRRSVRELAGMPGLLAQVSAEVVISPPDTEPVPDTLLPRLDREVRRARTRRTWLGAGIAAAVVLIASAFGAFAINQALDDDAPPAAAPSATTSTSPSSSPDASTLPMDRVGQDVLDADVTLTSVGWGTKLDLTCSYRDDHEYPPPRPWTYVLVVTDRDGQNEHVGTWKALPGKTLSLTSATATPVADIASLEVQLPDGTTVLRTRT
jgi:putative zinc finger protein